MADRYVSKVRELSSFFRDKTRQEWLDILTAPPESISSISAAKSALRDHQQLSKSIRNAHRILTDQTDQVGRPNLSHVSYTIDDEEETSPRHQNITSLSSQNELHSDHEHTSSGITVDDLQGTHVKPPQNISKPFIPQSSPRIHHNGDHTAVKLCDPNVPKECAHFFPVPLLNSSQLSLISLFNRVITTCAKPRQTNALNCHQELCDWLKHEFHSNTASIHLLLPDSLLPLAFPSINELTTGPFMAIHVDETVNKSVISSWTSETSSYLCFPLFDSTLVGSSLQNSVFAVGILSGSIGFYESLDSASLHLLSTFAMMFSSFACQFLSSFPARDTRKEIFPYLSPSLFSLCSEEQILSSISCGLRLSYHLFSASFVYFVFRSNLFSFDGHSIGSSTVKDFIASIGGDVNLGIIANLGGYTLCASTTEVTSDCFLIVQRLANQDDFNDDDKIAFRCMCSKLDQLHHVCVVAECSGIGISSPMISACKRICSLWNSPSQIHDLMLTVKDLFPTIFNACTARLLLVNPHSNAWWTAADLTQSQEQRQVFSGQIGILGKYAVSEQCGHILNISQLSSNHFYDSSVDNPHYDHPLCYERGINLTHTTSQSDRQDTANKTLVQTDISFEHLAAPHSALYSLIYDENHTILGAIQIFSLSDGKSATPQAFHSFGQTSFSPQDEYNLGLLSSIVFYALGQVFVKDSLEKQVSHGELQLLNTQKHIQSLLTVHYFAQQLISFDAYSLLQASKRLATFLPCELATIFLSSSDHSDLSTTLDGENMVSFPTNLGFVGHCFDMCFNSHAHSSSIFPSFPRVNSPFSDKRVFVYTPISPDRSSNQAIMPFCPDIDGIGVRSNVGPTLVQVNSLVCVAVCSAAGECLGVIKLVNSRHDDFSEDDVEIALVFAGKVAEQLCLLRHHRQSSSRAHSISQSQQQQDISQSQQQQENKWVGMSLTVLHELGDILSFTDSGIPVTTRVCSVCKHLVQFLGADMCELVLPNVSSFASSSTSCLSFMDSSFVLSDPNTRLFKVYEYTAQHSHGIFSISDSSVVFHSSSVIEEQGFQLNSTGISILMQDSTEETEDSVTVPMIVFYFKDETIFSVSEARSILGVLKFFCHLLGSHIRLALSSSLADKILSVPVPSIPQDHPSVLTLSGLSLPSSIPSTQPAVCDFNTILEFTEQLSPHFIAHVLSTHTDDGSLLEIWMDKVLLSLNRCFGFKSSGFFTLSDRLKEIVYTDLSQPLTQTQQQSLCSFLQLNMAESTDSLMFCAQETSDTIMCAHLEQINAQSHFTILAICFRHISLLNKSTPYSHIILSHCTNKQLMEGRENWKVLHKVLPLFRNGSALIELYTEFQTANSDVKNSKTALLSTSAALQEQKKLLKQQANLVRMHSFTNVFLTRCMLVAHSPAKVFFVLRKHFGEYFHAFRASLFLVEPRYNELYTLDYDDLIGTDAYAAQMRIPYGVGLAGYVAKCRQAVLYTLNGQKNTPTDFDLNLSWYTRVNIGSIISVPIIDNSSSSLLGVVEIVRGQPASSSEEQHGSSEVFNSYDLEVLKHISQSIVPVALCVKAWQMTQQTIDQLKVHGRTLERKHQDQRKDLSDFQTVAHAQMEAIARGSKDRIKRLSLQNEGLINKLSELKRNVPKKVLTSVAGMDSSDQSQTKTLSVANPNPSIPENDDLQSEVSVDQPSSTHDRRPSYINKTRPSTAEVPSKHSSSPSVIQQAAAITPVTFRQHVRSLTSTLDTRRR